MDEQKMMGGIYEILKKVEGIEKHVEGLEKRMDGLEKRMDGLEKRMEDGFRQVNARLDRLESGIDLLAHKHWKNEEDVYYLKQQFEKMMKEGA